MIRALSLVLLWVPVVAAAKKTTISIDAGEGELTLIFDPDKVTEGELKAAAALAPEAAPDGDNIPTVENCAGGSEPGTPAFLEGGERCLKKGREELARLDAIVAPPEMQGAVNYLKEQANFFFGLEQAKVAFLRSGGARAELEKPIAGLDPKSLCKDALARVGDKGELKERFHTVSFAFHNCMNDASAKKRGNYPKAPWKAFLKARGVTAKFKGPTGD